MLNLLEKVEILEEAVTNFSEQPSSEQVKALITVEITAIIDWISGLSPIKFFEFEKGLIRRVFSLGRLFIAFFLCLQEERWQRSNIDLNPGEKRQGVKDRLFGTIFGKVRYWRTYIYRGKALGGYYPLDIELGLPWDAFSMLLRSYAARIATKMSYAQTVAVLALFLGWSPCQKTVEEMVLGMGRHTSEWFESCPPPKNDGEILIIQADSKATPTATEEELKKRRGKRSGNSHSGSPRHRRKANRRQKGSKKRKKKGDKSKNGRMVTIVVMYTLRRCSDGTLEGPINKIVYASYAPKQHVIAIARREADKRGFSQDSGKTVQIITDGDNDLERYIVEFFPEAKHTISFM
jgi:hypothetical protein